MASRDRGLKIAAGTRGWRRGTRRDDDSQPSGRAEVLVWGERLLEGSSLIRFAAELPNQLWQIDAAHWSLAGARSVEISYHNAWRVGP